jgi:hypothetical protein
MAKANDGPAIERVHATKSLHEEAFRKKLWTENSKSGERFNKTISF